eukprot:TRINITY_DN27129_c0_g1_i2.p1 TRINITY_DN27129_c0_g1~~TRINITY_DN27129_c0_g1_i2.p1  ORF type:complete len:262 (-),score=40.04 TRINITY_DN27129_c0_g1_i2:203-988(-)
MSTSFRLTAILVISCLASFADADASAMKIEKYLAENVDTGKIDETLTKFTEFSEKKGLGMALGKQKADIITEAVRMGLPSTGPATVLEMGCHAGDGTLAMARALEGRSEVSKIVSTEMNKDWLAAANKICDRAFKSETPPSTLLYRPILMSPQEIDEFEDFLTQLIADNPGEYKQFDAVVFDHEEDKFLPHLQTLVKLGLLRNGATVLIDNVKRKATQLADYMKFVDTKAGNGFETIVKKVSKPYPDEVAISTWKGSSNEL